MALCTVRAYLLLEYFLNDTIGNAWTLESNGMGVLSSSSLLEVM